MSIIRIEARTVSLGVTSPFEHSYLVYQDDSGTEFVLRGGPSLNFPPWGYYNIISGGLLDESLDARGSDTLADRGSIILDLQGRDADLVWESLIEHAANIDNAGFLYRPLTQNCNSFVASLLHSVGLSFDSVTPSVPGINLYTGTSNILDSFNWQLGVTAVNYSADHNDIYQGGRGNDVLLGGNGADTLTGGDRDDLLAGGSSAVRDDIFFGVGGEVDNAGDILNGGEGFDSYFVSPATGGASPSGFLTISELFGATVGSDGSDYDVTSPFSGGDAGVDFIRDSDGRGRVMVDLLASRNDVNVAHDYC